MHIAPMHRPTPPIEAIYESTFKDCSNLMHLEFDNKIEQFVSCEAIRDLWNRSLHEKVLSKYCFLSNATF